MHSKQVYISRAVCEFVTAEKFLDDKVESFFSLVFLGNESAERKTSAVRITILSASRIFGECTVNAAILSAPTTPLSAL